MKVLSLFVIGCTLGCKYSRWSMLKPKWVASPANSIMVKTQNNPCRVLFSRTPTPVNLSPKLQIFRFSLYLDWVLAYDAATPMAVTESSGNECSECTLWAPPGPRWCSSGRWWTTPRWSGGQNVEQYSIVLRLRGDKIPLVPLICCIGRDFTLKIVLSRSLT